MENYGKSVARGVILEVPYKEKEKAKQLGAWWDPEMKKWFVPRGVDSAPFRRWLPSEEAAEVNKKH